MRGDKMFLLETSNCNRKNCLQKSFHLAKSVVLFNFWTILQFVGVILALIFNVLYWERMEKAGAHMWTKRFANSSCYARGKLIFCESEVNTGHRAPPNSLCACAKKQQILVRGKLYANHSQMAQRMFAVPSTHTRILFVNCSRNIWFACVYQA